MTKKAIAQDLSEVDLLYLQHQSQCVIHAMERKAAILGYFILINISFYAAVYALSPGQNVWIFSNLKLFLVGLLFMINSAIYVINTRDQELNVVIQDSFYELMKMKVTHPLISQMIKRIEVAGEQSRGLSSKVMNALLSVFSAVPIALFVTLCTSLIYPHTMHLSIFFLLVTVVFTAIYFFKIP